MNTTTTGQQAAARALVAILAHEELPQLTWYLWPDTHSGVAPQLVGQFKACPLAEACDAVSVWADAFGLTLDRGREVLGSGPDAAFTDIGANGTVDGVSVRIWCAAKETGVEATS